MNCGPSRLATTPAILAQGKELQKVMESQKVQILQQKFVDDCD